MAETRQPLSVKFHALNLAVLYRRGYVVNFMPRGDFCWMFWKHRELGCRIDPEEVDRCDPYELEDVCRCREYLATVEIEMERKSQEPEE